MQCDGDGVERWPRQLQGVGRSCGGMFRKFHRLAYAPGELRLIVSTTRATPDTAQPELEPISSAPITAEENILSLRMSRSHL
jgi:hypothetical protein